MPTTTVTGAGGIPFLIHTSGSLVTNLASLISSAITSGLGGLTQNVGSAGAPAPLPGASNTLTSSVSGSSFVVPTGYNYLVNTGNSTVFGDSNLSVVSSDQGMTFVGGTGTGEVVAGGGNNLIIQNPNSTYVIATGSGNDTIFAGNTSAVDAGGGANYIQGSFNTGSTLYVTGEGNGDTIVGGAGTNVIHLLNDSSHEQVIANGTSTLVIDEGMADTINAGFGTTLVQGGNQSVIVGGTGHLFFAGSGSSTITGGTGQETLFGGASTLVQGNNGSLLFVGQSGNDTVYAGGGTSTLFGGAGNDTFVAGIGASTMVGGSGTTTFDFVKGSNGMPDVIMNFGGTDKLMFSGYGQTVQQILSNAQTVGGVTTLTLSDNTRITIYGAAPNAGNTVAI